ncbi:MAG: hypothetical protein KKE37_12590 [Verrucomicrobia bacterium]|nr:hypothetical protein [Verrucomicrobiota bacterium]MBU4430176.1 hypothetical protein [Verrucomicrobiota bacterium]
MYFRFWDATAQAPFVYAPALNNGMFITYDDPESIQGKVSFVREHHLGGIMIWELSGDARADNASLLTASYQGFMSP